MERNDLSRTLKNKRIRKIAMIALAICIVVGVATSMSIEGKDSKIEDGQGNMIVNTAGNSDETANTDSDDNAIENDSQDELAKADMESEDVLSNSKEISSKPVAEKATEAKSAKDIKLTEEQKKDTVSKDLEVDNSSDFTASNGGNIALRPETPENVSVTLEIRCDTLSKYMEYLETESIRDYIPTDGIILAKTTYNGTTDNTVFDVLNTLCRNNDIQLEFSFTPVYESYYIEGINFLYEFDGGPQSGWMYKVNDWFPNYGCSSYYLSDGDEIVFCYTCRGLGADVGDGVMGS